MFNSNFNYNHLLSSFPSPTSYPTANFIRDVPAASHASSTNCGHDDREDLEVKKIKKKKKKGRYTKIRTARGVRDRRVRLSMEVSRKFFGLQDALGFDTASDTLEWLISESGNAIEELKLANEGPVRGLCTSPADAALACDPLECNRAEKEARRECRARARARARERTQAKRIHDDGCSSQSRSDFLP